ncbi:hypothetical protein CEQ90_05200 [Lewinellaceae bacterium SD302]|nr:hypothetical protein CEQ90_05200 [Lewinellaceae bacterium SD302]
MQQNFNRHCQKFGRHGSVDDFTTYIVDEGLIQNSAILRYAILGTYEEITADSQLSKTQIVDVLAERFNLTSRSIWNALRANK